MAFGRVVLFAAVLVLFAVPGVAQASGHDCLGCHEDETPGVVRYWAESRHAEARVGCTDCHGSDAGANHGREVAVTARVCGRCHEGPYNEHLLSKHSISLKTGGGCTRNLPDSPEKQQTCSLCHVEGSREPIVRTECGMFLAQSPEMQRASCTACHKVETGCDTCHGKHGTDLGLARSAETCGVCHMGPDHAQYEMWRSSVHGVVYREMGEKYGPTCVTCHMQGGTHNVSRGIATGKPGDIRKAQRRIMVEICSGCHTPALARRNLEDADRIQQQSLAIVAEAQAIVEELNEEGLLEPAPGERPGHPIFGQKFVIGPLMLYEDLSRAETIFFRMMMFHYMSAFKGAFHQSPDYAHWFGNAPLKLSLSELRSEAAMLRNQDRLRKRLENLGSALKSEGAEAGGLKMKLIELRDKMLRGEITEREYEERKKRLLDERGL